MYRARAAGFEPVTSSVTGKRSNQLSYARNPVAYIGYLVFKQNSTFRP